MKNSELLALGTVFFFVLFCFNVSIQEIKNRQNKDIDVKQITVMLTLLKSFFVVSDRK